MFSEQLMANRPKARVLRLIGLVLVSPFVATLLVGLSMVLIEVLLIAPTSGRGLFNAGVSTSLLIYGLIGFAMVVVALPFMLVGLLVGHLATPRRPKDGAVLGAVGVGLCILAFSALTNWQSLAYMPLMAVGAFMGWLVIKFGYQPVQPQSDT